MTNIEISIIGAWYEDAIQIEEFCNMEIKKLYDDSYNKEETILKRDKHRAIAENLESLMNELHVPAETIKHYRETGKNYGGKSFFRTYMNTNGI